MNQNEFLMNYQSTDIKTDPLPIKVLRHSIRKDEILGQALHWSSEYLHQKYIFFSKP